MGLRRSLFIFLIVILYTTSISTAGSGQSKDTATQSRVGIPSEFTPPMEDLADLEEAIDDSEEQKPYQIPVILNDSVESHLEYFKTRGREVFQIWLNRSAKYIPMMKEILKEKNLPEELVYVAMIESGFNPYAVSWAKAVGPWQFMAATARMYGLKIDWWIDERKDPVKSTHAAAEHLKDLHNMFGSWPLALASYNAGAGKVQRAVLRTRSEDFWDIKASRYIRRETKNYVPKYMAATIIAKNPEAYGFTIPEIEPFAYDEVEIHESTDLRLIARCAGTSYEKIRELNPELKRWVTPPGITSYTLRIPKGTKETFLANFATIPPEQKIKWERYEIQRGDTLSKIARKFNSIPDTIREVNGLKTSGVKPGRHLLIPVGISNAPFDINAIAPATSKKEMILYRVRRGENLWTIAKEHNVSVTDIREWNKGIGNTVRAGQKIRLFLDPSQI